MCTRSSSVPPGEWWTSCRDKRDGRAAISHPVERGDDINEDFDKVVRPRIRRSAAVTRTRSSPGGCFASCSMRSGSGQSPSRKRGYAGSHVLEGVGRSERPAVLTRHGIDGDRLLRRSRLRTFIFRALRPWRARDRLERPGVRCRLATASPAFARLIDRPEVRQSDCRIHRAHAFVPPTFVVKTRTRTSVGVDRGPQKARSACSASVYTFSSPPG